MADIKKRIVIDDCRGGMNGVDDPLSLAPNECLRAVNIDWFRAPVGHKRYGSEAHDMTNATMTGKVSALIRHVPGTSETAAEMWAVDDAATPIINRFTTSAGWSAPTLKDNPSGSGWNTFGASLDGKLYLAYQSAQNRLHVWDGSTVRRAGINPGSTAPTAANTGAGAYAATIRYYRVRFSQNFSRLSEATPSVSFTPSGGGTAARVTMPTAPNEGETHWTLEASADNVTFYQIAFTVVGTTTFDDTNAPADYDNFTLSPSTGTFTLHKPYRFVAADQNRLLGFGSYNANDQQHRVWFSDLVGGVTLGALGLTTSDAADRLNTTGGYFLDLDEHDSGSPTGLAGPINGAFYAFKSTQIWELRATGDPVAPFRATCLSKTVGAVCQQAITRGEDAQGRPCLYFMSQFGPYRYGANGLEWIGQKVDNYIRGVAAGGSLSVSNNIDLSPTAMTAVAVYYPAKKTVWWWFAVHEASDANGLTACLTYDVTHGGWAEQSVIYARAAILYAHPQTGLPSQVPYMAYANANETIYVLDHPGAVTDPGASSFAAYLFLRPIEVGGPGRLGAVTDVEVLVQNSSAGGLFRVETQGDLGTTLTAGATLTLPTSTGASWVRAESAALADLHCAHVWIGNLGDGADDNVWRVHRVVISVSPQEASVG